MLASSLGTNDRVRTTELKMSTRRTISIAKHVEYRNTAPEVLCGRLSIVAGHVQHSVKPVCFASEIQIGGRVGCLRSNSLKFPTAILKFILF